MEIHKNLYKLNVDKQVYLNIKSPQTYADTIIHSKPSLLPQPSRGVTSFSWCHSPWHEAPLGRHTLPLLTTFPHGSPLHLLHVVHAPPSCVASTGLCWFNGV